MDPSRFRRLIDMVGAALEHDPADRDAYLVEQCGDDEALLAEARGLLASSSDRLPSQLTAQMGAMVERAAVDAVDHTDLPEDHPPENELPPAPATIGPYQVVRTLGRGGMGVVYLGRRGDGLRRDVAIKVVRAGHADPDSLVRFRGEQQALARMQHPGIARVFDAGRTDDGLPYFVMELVEGRPITEYCDGERLGLDARLDLFRPVCLAVHHAHQRGVIHRDLKPSNILVTEVDGCPVAKIIDFGIAKAVKGFLSDESIHTRIGSVIGTLDYMSPEQLSGGEDGVDVRADVYALGVILYQLVTGRHPFEDTELRHAGLLEAQRIILERDPPRPSWTLGHARASGVHARARATDDRTLRRRLRGDLDWVVMKALEKDRERRYQSASDLSGDLQRYANHQPVQAGPPSVGYRVRKFVRRHRVGVTAAALIVAALLGGTGLATAGFVRATAEARRTAAISAFLTDMLASVQPDQRGREITVREVLDVARARLEAGEFSEDPGTESELALVVGHSYEGLGRYDDARETMRRSMEVREREYGPDDRRTFDSKYRLATVLWKQGLLDEALAMRLELAETTERTVGAAHPDHAESLSNLGNTYADMGDLERSVELLTEAVAVGRRLEGEDGELDLARFLNNLGTVQFDLEEYAAAIEVYHEALDIRSRIIGEDTDVYAITLVNLGNAQLNQGDLETAETTLRRAIELELRIFGGEHPSTAFAYAALSEALFRQGRLSEAESYSRQALAIRIATTGSSYWRAAIEHTNLAEILMEADRMEEAEAELTTAWAGLEAAGELSHPRALRVARTMAMLRAELGDREGADRWAGLAGES